MSSAICLGELLIDFVPTVTGMDLINTPAFKKAAGGAPGNVAVGMRQLGIDTAFIGKVGNDAFGHFLTRVLADKGVDVSPVLYSNEARTGLAFVSLKADGDRDFLFYRHPSADMLLRADEIDTDLFAKAKLLHFGSISLIDQPVRDATLFAVETAKKNNCLVSYDPNLRIDLWPSEKAAKEGLLRGLAQANIVKINEDEVDFLTGAGDTERSLKQLWHDDLQLMVITRGGAGCSFFTPELRGDVDSFKVEAIDTTGAGDGFVAGLLQGILKDQSVLQSDEKLQYLCRFANAVGAITTTERGAIPALPDFNKVQNFLEHYST